MGSGSADHDCRERGCYFVITSYSIHYTKLYDFRGLHRLVPTQNREKCVACYLCPTVCPAKCITVEAAENETGEKYPRVYQIDLLRCIFCGYCVEACPVEAIEMTGAYELADYHREDFAFTKERLLK